MKRDYTVLYFSIVTMTPTGYGDLTPVTSQARSLASLEQVAGHFYMAVVMARLVGLYQSAKNPFQHDGPQGSPGHNRRPGRTRRDILLDCVPLLREQTMTMSRIFSNAILMLSLSLVAAFSDVPACLGAEAEDKQKAIQALFTETGMEKRTDEITKEFTEAIRSKLYEGLVGSYMKNNTSMEQKEAERIAEEKTKKVMDKFVPMLQDRINFKADLLALYTSVIDKNMSLDDINFLLKYNRSPIGKKAASVERDILPTATKELTDSLMTYVPKIMVEITEGKPAGTFTPNPHTEEMSAIPASKLELIKRMLDATDFTGATVNQWKEANQREMSSRENLINSDASLSEEDKKKKLDRIHRFNELMATRIDAGAVLAPIMILSYNKAFTEPELKELSEFFTDPRNRKLLANSGSLQSQIMSEFQKTHHQKLTDMLEEAGKGVLTE